MPNPYFKFKHFTINQSASAMKVGTDGVLLGAWVNLPENGSSALDVGSGTGLLALMLAQRYPGLNISAIEIEKSSCKQAKENFSNSDWEDRIGLFEMSFQDFIVSTENKYDMIISNPPYFRDSLKNPNEAKSLARHQDTLSLEVLLEGTGNLLSQDGLFSLILPFDQKKKCLELAELYGLFPVRFLNIRPKPEMDYKRILMEFSFAKKEWLENELIIEMNARHSYSAEYKELTKDFYLKF